MHRITCHAMRHMSHVTCTHLKPNIGRILYVGWITGGDMWSGGCWRDTIHHKHPTTHHTKHNRSSDMRTSQQWSGTTPCCYAAMLCCYAMMCYAMLLLLTVVLVVICSALLCCGAMYAAHCCAIQCCACLSLALTTDTDRTHSATVSYMYPRTYMLPTRAVVQHDNGRNNV